MNDTPAREATPAEAAGIGALGGADSILEVEIDESLLAGFEAACARAGMAAGDAVAAFARNSVACGGFPFDLDEDDWKFIEELRRR